MALISLNKHKKHNGSELKHTECKVISQADKSRSNLLTDLAKKTDINVGILYVR